MTEQSTPRPERRTAQADAPKDPMPGDGISELSGHVWPHEDRLTALEQSLATMDKRLKAVESASMALQGTMGSLQHHAIPVSDALQQALHALAVVLQSTAAPDLAMKGRLMHWAQMIEGTGLQSGPVRGVIHALSEGETPDGQ